MSKVIASTPIMEIGKINKNNSIIPKEAISNYDEELVRKAINNSPIVQDILNNGTTFIGEIQYPKDFEEGNNEY